MGQTVLSGDVPPPDDQALEIMTNAPTPAARLVAVTFGGPDGPSGRWSISQEQTAAQADAAAAQAEMVAALAARSRRPAHVTRHADLLTPQQLARHPEEWQAECRSNLAGCR